MILKSMAISMGKLMIKHRMLVMLRNVNYTMPYEKLVLQRLTSLGLYEKPHPQDWVYCWVCYTTRTQLQYPMSNLDLDQRVSAGSWTYS